MRGYVLWVTTLLGVVSQGHVAQSSLPFLGGRGGECGPLYTTSNISSDASPMT